jgi:competence protein ComGC
MDMKGLTLLRIISILSYIFLSIIPTVASEETIIQARDEEAQKRVTITKLKIKKIDSESSYFSINLKLFARLYDPVQSEKEGYLVTSNKVVLVPDPDSWPDNTIDSYLVLLNGTGSVIAFEWSPQANPATGQTHTLIISMKKETQ